MAKTAETDKTAELPYADELRLAIAEMERGEFETFTSMSDLLADLNDDDPPYADKLRLALAEVERGEFETFTDTHAMFAQILAE